LSLFSLNVGFPNFSQNDVNFPNLNGPSPISKEWCESPEKSQLSQGEVITSYVSFLGPIAMSMEYTIDEWKMHLLCKFGISWWWFSCLQGITPVIDQWKQTAFRVFFISPYLCSSD
jgi:hypothetical protein